jgi:hypothetical protein
MAKKDLNEMVIPEIPSDEKILKEGVLRIVGINKRSKAERPFKYAITEKGIWTRSPGGLIGKPFTRFVPYKHFDYLETAEDTEPEYCIFHPRAGEAPNRIYFDDHFAVVDILKEFLDTEDDLEDEEDEDENDGNSEE